MAYNNTVSAKKSTGRRFWQFLLLLLLILAIVSLSKNAWGLINRGLVVKREEDQLFSLRAENQQLKARLDYIKSDQFLEQEARDNLGLVRGESVVILPSSFSAEETKPLKENNLAPIKQWLNLFFN